MEITDYFRLFRKRWWLFVLGIVLGAGLAYSWAKSQVPLYRAEVMLSIGTYIQSPNPSSSEITTGAQLARTYQILLKTARVLQATITAGGFDLSPDAISNMVDTEVLSGTSLLRLRVTNADPVLAAAIANELANQLILNSPTNLTPEQQEQVTFVSEEIGRLQTILAQMNERLDEINTRLAEGAIALNVGDRELTQLTDDRNLLIEQINATSATIAAYSNAISNYQAKINSLDIIQPASVPDKARAPDPWSSALISGLAGGIAVLVLTMFLEYLDDTIKTSEDILQVLGLPVLGKIGGYGGFRKRNPGLVTLENTTSPIAEEYRALRTRLLYANENYRKQLYIVTSPSAADGKTVTASNLAVTLAFANYRVLLVDADLRRPRVHEVFGLRNEVGLSSLLEVDPSIALSGDPEQLTFIERFANCIQDTQVPGLRVMTSGPIPPNPAERLGSVFMQRWFTVLERADAVDVIIFDTPPVLSVADTYVLAATTGAPVVLVVRSRRTRRHAALEVKEQFRQLGLTVRGVVLNRVRSSDMTYTAPYYYGAGSDTLPHREVLPVMLEPVTATAVEGKRTAAERQTDRLNKSRAVPQINSKDMQRNAMVLFVEDHQEPLSVMVSRRVTLGRYREDAPQDTHVDLDAFNAFDKGVSRVHLAIHRRSDGFYVEDLGSSNGSWLNNESMIPHQVYPFANGGEVRLGALRIRMFYLVEGGADQEAAAPEAPVTETPVSETSGTP